MALFAAWRFRLRAHTLQIETTTWTHNTSLLVTSAMLILLVMMNEIILMSNTPYSTAPTHTWSLSEGLMHPYFLLQASKMCLLFWARKTTSFISSFMH